MRSPAQHGANSDRAILCEHGSVGSLKIAPAQSSFVFQDEAVNFPRGESGKIVHIQFALWAVTDAVIPGHAIPIGGTGGSDTEAGNHLW